MKKKSEVYDFLLKKGFKKVKKGEYDRSGINFDLMLRIHDNHFLVWNEKLNFFSLAYKHEKPKKITGSKEKEYYKNVMFPKPCYTVEDAEKYIEICT